MNFNLTLNSHLGANDLNFKTFEEVLKKLPENDKSLVLANPLYANYCQNRFLKLNSISLTFLDVLDNTVLDKKIDERDFHIADEKFENIVVFECLHLTAIPEKLVLTLAMNLKLGGKLQILNIPNLSKLDRSNMANCKTVYKSTFQGKPFKRSVQFSEIDDAMLIGLVLRLRAYGFESYLEPSTLSFCDNLSIEKNYNTSL